MSLAKACYALLPIGYMGVLFYASSLTGDDPRLRLGISDKVLHAGAYAVLAPLWYIALRRGWGVSPWKATALAWLISVAYGITDEIHQSFVPRRDPSLSDLVADGVGAGASLLALTLARFGWARRRTHPDRPRRS